MNSSIRQDRERRTDSITKEVVDKERLLPEEVSKLTSIYCTNKGRDQETGIPRQKLRSYPNPLVKSLIGFGTGQKQISNTVSCESQMAYQAIS